MERRFVIYCCYTLLLSGLFACKKETATPEKENPLFNKFLEMETDLPYQQYFQAWFMNDSTGFIVGTKGALMKTVNGGKNWSRMETHTDFMLSDIQFMNDNRGYVLGYNDEKKGIILQTTDAGYSWEIFRQFDDLKPEGMSFPDGSTGFILLGGRRLLKTVDGGVNWSESAVNIESTNKIRFIDQMRGYITSADGLYYETWDGGLRWNRFKGPISETLHQIYFHDKQLILKSDSRLYYEPFGAAPGELLTIPSSELLEFADGGRGIAIGGKTGPKGLKPTTYVYVSIDNLKTWSEKRPEGRIMTLSRIGVNKFLMIGTRSGRTLIFTLEL